MKVRNINGLTVNEMHSEISNGARFVVYDYTISALIITIRKPSDIYFVRAHEKSVLKGLPYTLLTVVLGWWGIPWGPIRTIQTLYKNLRGGTDVTNDIVQYISSKSPIDEVKVDLPQ